MSNSFNKLEITPEDIDDIILKIIKSSPHNWVRYYICEKVQGVTMPGHYIEIRSSYIPGSTIKLLNDVNFNIENICSQKINADTFIEITFKSEVEF